MVRPSSFYFWVNVKSGGFHCIHQSVRDQYVPLLLYVLNYCFYFYLTHLSHFMGTSETFNRTDFHYSFQKKAKNLYTLPGAFVFLNPWHMPPSIRYVLVYGDRFSWELSSQDFFRSSIVCVSVTFPEVGKRKRVQAQSAIRCQVPQLTWFPGSGNLTNQYAVHPGST